MKKIERTAVLAVCLLCAAITGYYLIAGYGAHLDADMSSELALAQHLVQEGTLVSRTWEYSTEVRVLSTQLVFTPLMALFPDNWQLVRTLGCMILLALMAGSMVFCACSLGAKRRYACLTAALGVLPWSTVYAQMVVIGAYYVPHAILTCLLVGLCARLLRGVKGRNGALLLAAALALSALMCATSIRYILCAALPVAAAGVWMALFPAGGQALSRGSDEARALTGGAGVLAAGGIGYVLGKKVLSMLCLWHADYMGGSKMAALYNINLFDLADEALDGLIKLLGYVESSRLFSIRGILSMGAAALIVLSALLFVRALREAGRSADSRLRFGVLCAVMSAGLTFVTFLFVDGMYINRYWIPVVSLCLPVLALCLSHERNRPLCFLAAAMLSAVLLGAGFMHARQSMKEPEISQRKWQEIQVVQDTGASMGYATFWNANIITELTDGKVEMVSMTLETNALGQIYPQAGGWLEVQENLELNKPEEPVLLLLSADEALSLEDFLSLCGAQEQEMPAQRRRLFVVGSQREFFEAAQAMKDAQP